MSLTRGLLSVVVAWSLWLLGHALIAWQGLDLYRRIAMNPLGMPAEDVPAYLGPLLVLVLGGVLLGLSATSLLLSPVGLLSVGVVQTLVAVTTGFAWSTDTVARLIPDPLLTTAYPSHLFLGVWLVLGLVATALAAASWLRGTVGSRSGSMLRRGLSLLTVPVAVVALLPLLHGAGLNLRTLQLRVDVSFSAILLLLVAAVLLAIVAAAAGASALGPAVSGTLLVLIGLVAVFLGPGPLGWASPEMSQGWMMMTAFGGLVLIGLVLSLGSLGVCAAAHLPGARPTTTGPTSAHRTS